MKPKRGLWSLTLWSLGDVTLFRRGAHSAAAVRGAMRVDPCGLGRPPGPSSSLSSRSACFFFFLKNNTFIMVKLTLSKAYDLITFDLCP